jgi:hypothetical protein
MLSDGYVILTLKKFTRTYTGARSVFETVPCEGKDEIYFTVLPKNKRNVIKIWEG